MRNLYWLSEAQMARLQPFFPKSHGKPRVDDLRVLSGIIFINRNGLRWCDASKEFGPVKTLYNRWKHWSDNGVFARIMVGLASERAEHETIMISATYLKAHRTASSLRAKRGGGRQIGRTKGGMNTKLHAATDAKGAVDRVLHVGRLDQRLHRRSGFAGQPVEGGLAAGRQRL